MICAGDILIIWKQKSLQNHKSQLIFHDQDFQQNENQNSRDNNIRALKAKIISLIVKSLFVIIKQKKRVQFYLLFKQGFSTDSVFLVNNVFDFDCMIMVNIFVIFIYLLFIFKQLCIYYDILIQLQHFYRQALIRISKQ